MTSQSRRRRQRSLTARAIVLGHPATAILHEGRTAHLQPHKSTDHRGRYAPGQRLAVLEMVPGPTACHIILTQVDGPKNQPEPFRLGHITISTARELGYHRLDAFQRYWITNHDQAWLGRAIDAGTDTDEEIERRFDQRWSGKLAWLLRFTIDRAAEPRLLAARSDELYVTSEAMALQGELPALTEAEWATHIGPQSRYREQDRLAQQRADRTTSSHTQRYDQARAAARAKGYDVRDECRRYVRLLEQGKTDKAARQLELLEARCFPAAA